MIYVSCHALIQFIAFKRMLERRQLSRITVQSRSSNWFYEIYFLAIAKYKHSTDLELLEQKRY